MNMFRLILLICFLLTSCSSSAPDSKITSFKNDAKAFCEVYNPGNWKDYPEDFELSQLYVEIGNRVSKVIKTDEFRKIFSDFIEQRGQNYYQFVKQRISQLQGEPFTCQYYEDFYNKINISGGNGVNKNNDIEINIVFDEQGEILINNNSVTAPNKETIKEELTNYVKDKSPIIIIHKTHNTTDEMLAPVLDAVAALGITRLKIVEPIANDKASGE